MTHRDRTGDPSGQWAGRREAAGDAGHRQRFPTPAPIRLLPVRLRDRNGGFLGHLEADPAVTECLGGAGLEACFDLAAHTKHVGTIFERVFGDG